MKLACRDSRLGLGRGQTVSSFMQSRYLQDNHQKPPIARLQALSPPHLPHNASQTSSTHTATSPLTAHTLHHPSHHLLDTTTPSPPDTPPPSLVSPQRPVFTRGSKRGSMTLTEPHAQPLICCLDAASRRRQDKTTRHTNRTSKCRGNVLS